MLIHDIQRNKTKVINFQGAAPKTFREEMLQNAPDVKVTTFFVFFVRGRDH